jgi:hypothetical protein
VIDVKIWRTTNCSILGIVNVILSKALKKTEVTQTHHISLLQIEAQVHDINRTSVALLESRDGFEMVCTVAPFTGATSEVTFTSHVSNQNEFMI